MANERKLDNVPAILFTVTGGIDGTVKVSSTSGFKVKSSVVITATSLPTLTLEVKAVLDKNTLTVGLPGSINNHYDLSSYTVLLSSAVSQTGQDRPNIPFDSQYKFTYEQEPTLARRTILVDEWGNFYDTKNPLTVQLSDGSINIGTVNANLDVQLTDKESSVGANDYDVTRIGDGVDQLAINSDGSINVVTMAAAATAIPTIENYNITLANTEYSYSFPLGTKQFSFADRNGDAKTRIAYILGDTNVKWKTINYGETYEMNNISTLSGFKIYFQSSKANRVIEIESWK